MKKCYIPCPDLNCRDGICIDPRDDKWEECNICNGTGYVIDTFSDDEPCQCTFVYDNEDDYGDEDFIPICVECFKRRSEEL